MSLSVLLVASSCTGSQATPLNGGHGADPDSGLTPHQQRMVAVWEQHTAAEFERRDVDETMTTMTDDPVITNVPVITGGTGEAGVREFYGESFVSRNPPDTEVRLLARTVGDTRIVDEVNFKFTHTVELPWILPGVKPTGKPVEVAIVAVVEFDGEKIAAERIYWDQASVLVQVGLLDPNEVPAHGAEAAQKLMNPDSVPWNGLMRRDP
jgi:carboxymethylenebutenolidase